MIGKWSHLHGRYPALEDPNPTYAATLREAVDLKRTWSVDALTADYNEAAADVARLKQALKDAKFALEATEHALAARLEADNLDSVTASGYRWTPTIEPYPQITDRAAYAPWAETGPLAEARSIPSATLKSYVKGLLDESSPLPPGVDVFLKPVLHRTKA